MIARLIATWLIYNLIPFSVFGIVLAWAGHHFDQQNTRASRLIFGGIVAGLIGTVFVTTGAAVVVYNPCNDPNYPAWLWWLTCWL